MHDRIVLATVLLAVAVPAQNLVPNGEFHQGSTAWTLTQSNDPLGTNGFNPARVIGQGPSMAVWANFQTLSSVMTATFTGAPVTIPAGTWPISFDVMWEKQVTTPIPSVTVNRVELRVRDNANAIVTTFTRNAPNQTGFFERASFAGSLNIATTDTYTFEVFMRHSNLAGIPYTTWVDNVVCGAPVVSVFGANCTGSGGFAPVVSTVNDPAVNSSNFAIELHDALAPTAALFVLGTSNATWTGGALPFALGGGCQLHVDPAVPITVLVSGNGAGAGTAAQVLSIPNNASFRGWQLFAQWGVFDFAVTNPFGLATTSGVGFVVQ